MRSFKVWAYRELSGAKYFEVLLDDRTRLRINFIEGLTTQQALIALGGALGLKLGPCRITPMNKLALFDEGDALPEEKKRKLFKALGSPLHDAMALELFAQHSGGADQMAEQAALSSLCGSADLGLMPGHNS
jgi:hypothetical protein